ncbi:TELOMERIC REPEAT BINDING PROTEIN [Salix koriyanagi]|uniref:TELOMERIC REPEAT BINDING PROTEIN n=1 Tax=Salix koriyanagi TaxID=2511006 RepID=A0A9Q0VGD7_9ROSI|nr:TELOMERIC REPEAT BINDING PROTEIN [Salix koriyanagi]
MVFQRRLDYGFNGYKVPVVPRAARSAGGRGQIRKKSGNNQKHAFEILESFDFQGSLASERFDYSETIYVAEKLGKVKGLTERKPEAELVKSNSIESGTLLVKDGLEDATDLDGGSIGQASVESNVKASLFKDSIGLCSCCRPCADVKVVSRDDDENSAGRSQYGAMPKTYRPLSYTETRRTSILTSSRHWRAAPNLKSGGYFRTGKCLLYDSASSGNYILFVS